MNQLYRPNLYLSLSFSTIQFSWGPGIS